MSDEPSPEAPAEPVSATPAPAQRTVKLPSNKVTYDGTGGKLFGLMIANFFLSCLTLGIYSFWGKTRVRRYLLSSTALNGKDRLQYTGTAMELLFGWLKAMLFLVPLIGGLIWAEMTKHLAVYFVFLALIWVLAFFGVYLALRYRLTRTRWRGIRFGLQGKSLDFVKLSMLRLVINMVTLGYKIPESDLLKWKYIADNMYFGTKKFSFSGSIKSLTWVNMVTLWLPLLPLMALGITMVTMAPAEGAAADPKDGPALALVALLFYITLFCGVMGRLWYRAALRAERMRGLKLEGLRFKSTATGKQYFYLKLVNALILVFTLWIGKAFTVHRNMKFEVTTLIIGGDVDQLAAEQISNSTKSDVGDELAPDLDMGAAVSIGL